MESLELIMFNPIFFEISGRCNAHCHWCYTGIANKNNQPKGNFVDFDEFVTSINYMVAHGIIQSNSTVFLYNWGEPFLHPKFEKIISFLNSKGVKYGLSTNGSSPAHFKHNEDLRGLVHLRFSMCGFSQASYSKIYGFSFEKIKQNIINILNDFRNRGFSGGGGGKFTYTFTSLIQMK
jgi:MoaA/NifB/PqqE/SkfB family radical SAM enzyme